MNLYVYLNKDAKLKLEVMQTEKQRTKCTVCANVSSGVHFGVLTCEGCKVRRNVKQKILIKVFIKDSLFQFERDFLAEV